MIVAEGGIQRPSDREIETLEGELSRRAKEEEYARRARVRPKGKRFPAGDSRKNPQLEKRDGKRFPLILYVNKKLEGELYSSPSHRIKKNGNGKCSSSIDSQ